MPEAVEQLMQRNAAALPHAALVLSTPGLSRSGSKRIECRRHRNPDSSTPRELKMRTFRRKPSGKVIAVGALLLAVVVAATLAMVNFKGDERLDCKIETRTDVERGVVESMPNCAQ